MARTPGSRNIQDFESRSKVETTGSQEIRHLASSTDDTALKQFKTLIKHQNNYLKWIKTRHDELNEAKKQLAEANHTNHRGPKKSTYRKYKWYAEHTILLEAINGFEVFYKQTLINLAKSIRNYVPPENLKGAIDVKILWNISRASVPELVFESQLYHDLDNIDKACCALIGAKRYNKSNPKGALKHRVKSLQAIFQIRHTLSHNHGVVTVSDRSKLQVLGYEAKAKDVIDPTKNDLRQAIVRLLQDEAKEFTEWLLRNTAKYLQDQNTKRGLALEEKTKNRIIKLLGNHQEIQNLNWTQTP